MPPLLPRSKKLRTALAVAASLVFVGVIVAILVSSADSGNKPTPARAKTNKPPVTAAKKNSTTLVMGPVVVQSSGFPTAVPPTVRSAVMDATQRYFDFAIQGPLRHGRTNNAYSKVFDAGVSGPAASRDRATMTEATTGPIRGPVNMQASRVRIDGLGDPTGKLALVATTFTLDVHTATPAGTLTIERHTELTFAKESGRWLVTAYRVTVRRSIGPKTTSTTAHSGPGTTT